MTILNKIVNAAANRHPARRGGGRDLIETILRRLPGVVDRWLREQAFSPGGIVDIGAYEGNWTRMIRGIFRAPPVLMIEVRKEQGSALQEVCSNFLVSTTRSRYWDASLSSPFHVSGTGSSIAERNDGPRAPHHIAMRTLDDILLALRSYVALLFLKRET